MDAGCAGLFPDGVAGYAASGVAAVMPAMVTPFQLVSTSLAGGIAAEFAVRACLAGAVTADAVAGSAAMCVTAATEIALAVLEVALAAFQIGLAGLEVGFTFLEVLLAGLDVGATSLDVGAAGLEFLLLCVGDIICAGFNLGGGGSGCGGDILRGSRESGACAEQGY